MALLIAGLSNSILRAANAADAATSEWPVLGGTSNVQHDSSLAQINDKNVQRLGLSWYTDIPSSDGLVGNPLVVDGVIYQGGPGAHIYANDLRTGKLLWTFAPEPRRKDITTLTYWALRFNRGLAVSGDNVYIGSGDCRLFAVNRKTGVQTWVADACDYTGATGLYGITGAPRVGNGLVFVGNACGDSGVGRGYVDAYDQKTGARRWRFFTVPDDPAKGPQATPELEMAAKSWGGPGWYQKSHGCGSVWEAISYDEKLDQLYIGTDGPAPWNPKARSADAGDELFTSSVVALDASSGKYLWHYKVVPHDGWNFCPCSHLMIADLHIGGASRHVVMTAPKNAFFYVLDAKSGRLISANNFTAENWASRVDIKTGRPVTLPDARYWEAPDQRAVVSPGPGGAHNWQAMAYNEQTGLVYIPVAVIPTLMEIDPAALGGARTDYLYGLGNDPKWKAYGELVAWDPLAQKERWRVKRALPVNGGLLTSAGNVVIGGTADGKFEAYAADSGKLLWSFDTGATILAAPTTVEVDGQQVVLAAIGNGAAANISATFAKLSSTPQTRTQARLLAFKIDGHAQMPRAEVRMVPKPPLPRFDAKLAKDGADLFEDRLCTYCHGAGAESAGGTIKDLRFASAQTHAELAAIVMGGSRNDRGMPRMDAVTAPELHAIQAFIINQAWDAYDAQQATSKTPAHTP